MSKDFCCCCRLLKIAILYFEILIITLCRFNRIDLNCNLWPLNAPSLVGTTYNNWTIFYLFSFKFGLKKTGEKKKNHYNTSFKDHLIVGEAISWGKYLSNSHLLSFIVMRESFQFQLHVFPLNTRAKQHIRSTSIMPMLNGSSVIWRWISTISNQQYPDRNSRKKCPLIVHHLILSFGKLEMFTIYK